MVKEKRTGFPVDFATPFLQATPKGWAKFFTQRKGTGKAFVGWSGWLQRIGTKEILGFSTAQRLARIGYLKIGYLKRLRRVKERLAGDERAQNHGIAFFTLKRGDSLSFISIDLNLNLTWKELKTVPFILHLSHVFGAANKGLKNWEDKFWGLRWKKRKGDSGKGW